MANANNKNRPLKWVVVKFTDTKDYSVLPINWLVENETENLTTCTVKFCKWPPLRTVTSDDLKKAVKPKDSWTQYQIKILGGNKTYEHFGKAWHIQVATSDSEEKVAKKRCRTPVTDSTDDEDTGFVIAPAISNSLLIGSQDIAFMDDIPQLPTTPIYTDMSIKTKPQSSTTEIYADTSIMIDQHFTETSILEQAPNFEGYQNDFSTSQILMSSNDTNTSFRTYEETQQGILKKILDEMITNRLMNERMLNQISSLKTEVAKLTSQMLPVLSNIPDKTFLDQFPFSSKMSIFECESKLNTDSDTNEQFQKMLCSVGGVDAKSNVRRILSKLFTNKLAIECSWTGRAFEKDATKFRIQELRIITIMKSIIKNQYSQYSDSNFELDVQCWFRTAKTRFDREKKSDNLK